MDTCDLNGLPPLRGAVMRLLSATTAFDIASLEGEAGVAHDRALAYVSILIKREALAISRGFYVRGPKFREWSLSVCRSRPRQRGSAASDRMDEIFEQVARSVKRLRNERDWSIRELSRRCGVHDEIVRRLETKRRRNVPFPALMLIAQALDTTVEVLATNC